ncbi:MAG: hypothetical protein CL946_05575 [Ectothiorhodospiraceae bacterium]|nr:hypothetical protein [Ectothiorhodospiraceae bacterium]
MKTTPFAVALVLIVLAIAGCGKNKPETEPRTVLLFESPASYPEFDGQRAFELVERQLSFGPRAPNSPGHAACAEFLHSRLASLCDTLKVQEFTLPGYGSERLPLVNFIGRFNPSARNRIILAAHWDTRPRADKEDGEADRSEPIPGANDGGSGTAVLLHIAEILNDTPPPIGVDIILFDGEDYGKEGDERMYCLGSQYFAANIPPEYDADFGILLDLVGDSAAVFPREGFSRQFAPDVVDLVWGNASSLGLSRFSNERYAPILDDHVWLNQLAGIKTVNIIDAELIGHADPNPRRQYWHTHRDDMRNISAQTLDEVGTLLLYMVFGLTPA